MLLEDRGERNQGSPYLNISKMLVIGSRQSSHLTCHWQSPIITHHVSGSQDRWEAKEIQTLFSLSMKSMSNIIIVEHKSMSAY